jgi:hypothetical protein
MTDPQTAEPKLAKRGGRRPRFVCVGGSTGGRWLYHQAASHPDVWMPPLKELRFFKGNWDLTQREAAELLNKATAQAYEGGIPVDEREIEFLRRVWKTPDDAVGERWAYYKLVNLAGDSLIGDVSPQYARLRPRAVRKLVHTLSRTQFVYLADDPVVKVWAIVRERVRRGHADPAVLEDADLLATYLKTRGLRRAALQSPTVELWTAKAGRRFAAFPFGLADANPQEIRQDLFAFIRLDGDQCAAEPTWSSRRGQRRPPSSLVPVIDDFLEDEPERLQRAIAASRQRRPRSAPSDLPAEQPKRLGWLPWRRRTAQDRARRG